MIPLSYGKQQCFTYHFLQPNNHYPLNYANRHIQPLPFYRRNYSAYPGARASCLRFKRMYCLNWLQANRIRA